MLRRLAPLVVFVVFGALGLTPASAAPDWITSSAIPILHDVFINDDAALAVDGAGDAAELVIDSGQASGEQAVEVSERPAGGAWSTPETLSRPGAVADEDRIAMDAAGDAVAVWVEDGAPEQILAAYQPAGGTWSAATVISTGTGDSFDPAVAVDSAGHAIAVWDYTDDTNSGKFRVVESSFTASNENWSTPSGLQPTTDETTAVHAPTVVMNAEGDAIVGWQEDKSGTCDAQVAQRPHGGSFGNPVTLGADKCTVNAPAVSLDLTGHAAAAWSVAENGGTDGVVGSFQSSTTGDWQAPATLDTGEALVDGVQLVSTGTDDFRSIFFSASGNVVTTGQIVESALDDGTWQATPTTVVAPHADIIDDAIATSNAAGDVALVYLVGSDLRGQVLPHDGTWSAGKSLFPSGELAGYGLPAVGLDTAGDAISASDVETSSDAFFDTDTYDATPPVVSDFRVRRNSKVGEVVQGHLTASDTWSGLASPPLWNWGDGKHSTGTDVTHVYTAAGTFAVTVTAVDNTGQVTSRAATVTVTGFTYVVTLGSTLSVKHKGFAVAVNTPFRGHLTLALREHGKLIGKVNKQAGRINHTVVIPATARGKHLLAKSGRRVKAKLVAKVVNGSYVANGHARYSFKT